MSATKATGTKGRLLFLERYLLEHTDDDHVLTTADLLQVYREHGYKCQRTTIPDDIAALAEAGIDIITEQVPRNETSMNAYHIGSRLFELAELKMLVDAVSSYRFITAEKSQQLIHKLSLLTNEEHRKNLTSNLYISDRLKTSNPNVLVNMDVIRRAIDEHRKISFHYWDYTPQKQKILRHNGEIYVASPYSLIWNDDRYYVAAYSDKHKKVIPYRVDRMCDVYESDEAAVESSDYDVSAYGRSIIRMYDDNQAEQQVTLFCDNTLIQKVIDRFGEMIETEVVDDQHFRSNIAVVPSSTFFGWVLQYKGGIIIEKPDSIKDAFESYILFVLHCQQYTHPFISHNCETVSMG